MKYRAPCLCKENTNTTICHRCGRDPWWVIVNDNRPADQPTVRSDAETGQ